jgi:hypothetical protein
MLWTIALVLGILWALGMVKQLHNGRDDSRAVLIALVMVVLRWFQGRRLASS